MSKRYTYKSSTAKTDEESDKPKISDEEMRGKLFILYILMLLYVRYSN